MPSLQIPKNWIEKSPYKGKVVDGCVIVTEWILVEWVKDQPARTFISGLDQVKAKWLEWDAKPSDT